MGPVARGYRIVLFATLALGAGLARLWGGPGVQVAAVIAGMIAAALVVAGAVVALTYAISRAHATPPPAEFRVGRLALAGAMLRELAAHLVVFGALVPFEALWMRRAPRRGPAGAGTPVVLVHGYLCGAGAWWRFARRLRARGFATRAVNVGPAFGSIDDMADALAREVEAACAAAGASRVSLVAHSMGGLVCRAYLRRHGGGHVARLVTIGTPHAGTHVAFFAAGANARQMEPGNAWLAGLAQHEASMRTVAGDGLPPAVAVFSYHDNYVAPQASSRLDWARSVPVAGCGHVEMYLSTRIAELAADALVEAGPESPDATQSSASTSSP